MFIGVLGMNEFEQMVAFDFCAEERLIGFAETKLNEGVNEDRFPIVSSEKADNVVGLGLEGPNMNVELGFTVGKSRWAASG